MDEEEFLLEYKALTNSVEKASPNSKILIMSILPVSQRKENITPLMSNERIDEFNSYLKIFAEDNSFEYLDLSDSLKNEYNALDIAFDAGDGLHFSSKAYKKLIEDINKIIDNSK